MPNVEEQVFSDETVPILCILQWKPLYTYFRNFFINEQDGQVPFSNKTLKSYSDISNNRTGTAIYFLKKILPIRSYQRLVRFLNFGFQNFENFDDFEEPRFWKDTVNIIDKLPILIGVMPIELDL